MSRERGKVPQPAGATTVLVVQDGEERLVEREIPSPPVARVDEVGVGRVKARLHRHEVRYERSPLDGRLVGPAAVEGERVVERAAARLHYDGHALGLHAVRRGA